MNSLKLIEMELMIPKFISVSDFGVSLPCFSFLKTNYSLKYVKLTVN